MATTCESLDPQPEVGQEAWGAIGLAWRSREGVLQVFACPVPRGAEALAAGGVGGLVAKNAG